MRDLWFNNRDMNGLWFNQTGQNLTPNDNGDDTEMPPPLWEYGGQTPLGDTIDQFEPESGISLEHPFDEAGFPEDLKFNHNQDHCAFVNNEINNIHTQMNFAKSQQEIDKLYERLDTLYDLGDEALCV